jgi:hypothetical protein
MSGKKTILGSSMFNFIANMVSKNPENSTEKSSTQETESSKNKNNVESAELPQSDQSNIESQNLATHLNKELHIVSDEETLIETKAEMDTAKSAEEF